MLIAIINVRPALVKAKPCLSRRERLGILVSKNDTVPKMSDGVHNLFINFGAQRFIFELQGMWTRFI